MGPLLLEVDFGLGSSALAQYPHRVGRVGHVLGVRLAVCRTHTREADDGLESYLLGWESSSVSTGFLASGALRHIFPVLLLALVNRRNRGLEDVVFGTVVAYDWLPGGTEPLTVGKMDAQIEIEVRETSVPIAP
jgi:hypothetical protein